MTSYESTGTENRLLSRCHYSHFTRTSPFFLITLFLLKNWNPYKIQSYFPLIFLLALFIIGAEHFSAHSSSSTEKWPDEQGVTIISHFPLTVATLLYRFQTRIIHSNIIRRIDSMVSFISSACREKKWIGFLVFSITTMLLQMIWVLLQYNCLPSFGILTL